MAIPDRSGISDLQLDATWVPSGNFPIAIDYDIRGGLRYISGNTNERLTNITGDRLEEAMLVYVKNA